MLWAPGRLSPGQGELTIKQFDKLRYQSREQWPRLGTSGGRAHPCCRAAAGCTWAGRDLALRVLVTHLGRLRLSLACRDVTRAAFPWSPASLHYVSCHPLPHTTREHGGTGAWETRRGESSPTPSRPSLAPAPRLLKHNMGLLPKDKTHRLKLPENQHPVCCCFNWKEMLRDLVFLGHLQESPSRCLGGSAFRMGKSQDCGC